MTLGTRLKELRKDSRLTLRELADKVGVGFTYLSKIENHKLEDGHAPSVRLIHKLATELGGNEDELLLLADKLPETIRQRVQERPDDFRILAELSDDLLDRVVAQVRRMRRSKNAV